MRKMQLVIVLLAAALVGSCNPGGGERSGFPDPQDWGFNFYDASTNTLQAVSLVKMAATASITPGRLNIRIPGCVLVLNFDVQFSGSAVRLLLFRIAPESNCNGVQIAQALGTGTANAAYGAATRATGTGTIRFTSPIGPGGGDIRWEAFLQKS
jgi:hypothetical protein